MKTKILTLTILTTIFVGCQKQPEQSGKEQVSAAAEFDASDKKIGEYLDILDDPKASKEEQTKILCDDYPRIYTTVYMPALIKLSPKDNNEIRLMRDLKLATDYYASKLSIKCT